MLLIERENEILSRVNENGVVTVRELADLCDVTEVTIRRDLKRLEGMNLLQRTHGGAVSLEKTRSIPEPTISGLPEDPIPDALIIGPVQNRAAHTLRERALRNKIPLLAESSGQEGAIYLGPKNFEASFELGCWTAEYVRDFMNDVAVLDITQEGLPNTRERSAGFKEGLRSQMDPDIPIYSVNGRALYNEAYQVALDFLRLHPEINVLFGINDDSILAGIQAYTDLGYNTDRLLAVNVGGEGKTLFDVLQRGGPLKACIALFPEAVGFLGVEAALRLWNDEAFGSEVITPYALLTGENLQDYYQPGESGWQLIADSITSLIETPWSSPTPRVRDKHLSFVIHYRTHEWYQNIARAMDAHCEQVGVDFSVEDVQEDLKAESRELRRLIGKLAASYVDDGDTIILDTGSTTSNMAPFLHNHRDLTVITNSLDVFQRLRSNPEITLIMVGGEFDRESQSFVGRGAHLLLQEMRADKAFLVAGGVSASFGISSVTMQEAEVRRSMIEAAREVIVLADHTVLDVESNFRVAGLDVIDTLITDAGILSSQSLALTQRGIKLIVAGQMSSQS